MLRPAASPLAALLLAGCPPPSALDPNALTSAGSSSSGEEEGSTSSQSSSSSGEPGTTEVGETAEESSTGEESTTTGEPLPAEPPEIVEAKWTPELLTKPGTAKLEVEVIHADGLEATYDGAAIELVHTDADRFELEVPINSELLDGTHTALLRATRGPVKGEEVEAAFVADLPTFGSEGKWEAGKGLGEGLAGKIVLGPKGELYEFGTLEPGGQRRCYLRRRTADGMAPVNDVVQLQPGKLCTATDVAVEPSGDLLLLYEYDDLGSLTWQLDRHDPWNQTLFPVLIGAPETKGNAVALGPEGEIAVCGVQPGGPNDTDMVAWLGDANNPIALDLVYDINKPHEVREVANDCAFVDSTLVIAGEADGQHPDSPMVMKRHAVVEVDLNSMLATWTVASGEGVAMRSSAQAVAADDAGGYVTAGHVCGEPCFPKLELRSFAPGGVLMSSFRPAFKTTVPSSIDWHPAGYAIVTAAEIISASWSQFWVQAWVPGDAKELWTYRRSDLETIHWAFDVAIGQTGLIFAVGVADIGGPLVPAFVILFP